MEILRQMQETGEQEVKQKMMQRLQLCSAYELKIGDLSCAVSTLTKKSFLLGFKLGFPKGRDSPGTSRDNPGQDVPFSLCPGTKKFSWPFVPGQVQEQKSQDTIFYPGTSQDKIIFYFEH